MHWSLDLDFNDTWSFLYNIKIIPEKSILEKVCADLQISLTDGKNVTCLVVN